MKGVDALLHISDISWVKHIKHPSDVLKKAQQIETVVLSIEPEKERMSVSLKDLSPDPWVEEIPGKFKPGDSVSARVVYISDPGIFVELEDGVEGLIYANEIDNFTDENIDTTYKAGDELTVRILSVDIAGRKIGLSLVK